MLGSMKQHSCWAVAGLAWNVLLENTVEPDKRGTREKSTESICMIDTYLRMRMLFTTLSPGGEKDTAYLHTGEVNAKTFTA
jgi:hypothetical protein